MVTLQKKQVKIISVLIALVFVGSVVALALTQSGSGIASAASSNVGVVDYRQIAQQSSQLQDIQSQMQKEVQDAQKEFEEKYGQCDGFSLDSDVMAYHFALVQYCIDRAHNVN